jgi:hypothetical protein
LAGGVPRPGVLVEGVNGAKYAPMPPRMYKNDEKTGNFTHFLAYKLPKTLFFAQKYLTSYTPEMFLEEYINCKFFSYLRHCGIIHVQSFRSYLGPQLPRLGLIFKHFNSSKKVTISSSKSVNISQI